MAQLRQNKSKWEVVGDDGRWFYSSHKTKKAAETALEIQEAWNALANGWDRLTERQKEVLRPLLKNGYDMDMIEQS